MKENHNISHLMTTKMLKRRCPADDSETRAERTLLEQVDELPSTVGRSSRGRIAIMIIFIEDDNEIFIVGHLIVGRHLECPT
jgi:hypothetical protein